MLQKKSRNSIIKEGSSFKFKNHKLITLAKDDLDLLKEEVEKSDLKRFRFCLHNGLESPIQEMLIGFKRGSRVPIHRHKDKTESFHVVKGLLDVVFYNDAGKEVDRIHLGDIDSGFPFMYRLGEALWHTIDIRSDFVVLHEITNGPFIENGMEVLNEI